MILHGVVQGGIVKLPDDAGLSDGTQVSIVPITTAHNPSAAPHPGIPLTDADAIPPSQRAGFSQMTLAEKMVALARWSETRPCDLPSDLAINHDHYLYGTPKKQ